MYEIGRSTEVFEGVRKDDKGGFRGGGGNIAIALSRPDNLPDMTTTRATKPVRTAAIGKDPVEWARKPMGFNTRTAIVSSWGV